MAHSAIFNETFCCGNILQVLESDLKTCNIVARISLESQNAPRRTKISHVDSHVNSVCHILSQSPDVCICVARVTPQLVIGECKIYDGGIDADATTKYDYCSCTIVRLSRLFRLFYVVQSGRSVLRMKWIRAVSEWRKRVEGSRLCARDALKASNLVISRRRYAE